MGTLLPAEDLRINEPTETMIGKYDNYLVSNHSDHARRVTIAMAKAERLRVKNERRSKHGLPPKKTYAEI